MKKSILLAASLLALNLTPVFGQSSGTLTISGITTSQDQPPALTKFNLDFPGGTPKELVKAIEKATGKPLNVTISDEYARTAIPALKMSNVNVPQLFNAVINMSYRYGPDRPGYSREVISSYGFETKYSPVSDDSIWYFFAYQATASKPPEKIVQFFNLDPFLNRGFTVDDITTAIQTGWKMAGESQTPELNYHKETKLLIAYGEPDKLKTINQVLETLPKSNVSIATASAYNSEIQSLQSKIAELNMKLKAGSTPAAVGTSTEKSGK